MKYDNMKKLSWIVGIASIISISAFAANSTRAPGPGPGGSDGSYTSTVKALQEGEWTVNVANLPAQKTPFQSNITLSAGPGSFVAEGFLNLPAGKRLVVETVSVVGSAPVGQKAIIKVFPPTTEFGSGIISLVPVVAGTIGTADNFAITQPCTLFGVNQFQVTMNRTQSTGTATAIVSVIGYLESI